MSFVAGNLGCCFCIWVHLTDPDKEPVESWFVRRLLLLSLIVDSASGHIVDHWDLMSYTYMCQYPVWKLSENEFSVI